MKHRKDFDGLKQSWSFHAPTVALTTRPKNFSAGVEISTPKARRAPRKPTVTAERGGIEDAMAILGLPKRTMQAQAQQIPGAAKFGRRWTFDLVKLRKLVRERERQSWRENQKLPMDAIGVTIPSGAAFASANTTSEGRFTQVIRRLRGPAGKR